jgi:hypothetical protein
MDNTTAERAVTWDIAEDGYILETRTLIGTVELKGIEANPRNVIASVEISVPTVPFVQVTGPNGLMSSDASATYKFAMGNMPDDISALTVTFRVEDAFFEEQGLNPLDGWEIIQKSGWVQNGEYWDMKVTFVKHGGSEAGKFDFFEAIMALKEGASGTTSVEILEASAASPGKVTELIIVGPAMTNVDPYSRFDVNRDGVVDLADVAAAAYFFMMEVGDANWEKPYTFEGLDKPIYPYYADVNSDGVVDTEDLIQILISFTVI